MTTLLMTVALLLSASCGGSEPTGVEEVSGLSQPRGIAGSGEQLCFAEAGAIPSEGSIRSSSGQIEADTGSVSCRTMAGDLAAVISGLPFVHYPDANVTSGVSDVLLTANQLFVLVGEAVGPDARRIIEVGPDGTTVVADLLAAAELRPDTEGAVRSNPWSLVLRPDEEGFYVSEAAAGLILEVGLDGAVSTFASAPGHEVLTGMTWGPDGRLFVASFGQLPHPEGSGAVLAIDAAGDSIEVASGLTMVIDVAFDGDGGMLVLEYSTPLPEPQGSDAYRDGAGRLLYIRSVGARPQVLLDSLARPTAMTVVGDRLHVSLAEGELAEGEGRIVSYLLSELVK